MSGRHAILGPSAASRWLTCTPSARFEEQIQEDESVYAREGTLAHELAALVLSSRAGIFRGGNDLFRSQVADLKKQVDEFYDQTPELDGTFALMFSYCEDWASYVCDLIEFDGIVSIEREYDLSQFVPLGFGTADATVKTPKVLHVVDFKYGAGVIVSATENPQLKLYGLGALTAALLEDPSYRPQHVAVHIVQPRAEGSSTFFITVSDLLEWAEYEVAPKAALAIAGQGDFIAGKHCQFCKAKTVCRAYFIEFEDLIRLKDKRYMTSADTAQVLEMGEAVAGWVKKVKEAAIDKIKNGGRVPGYKLVAGRGQRKFKNEDDVVDTLLGEGYDTDEIFEMKLTALTKIEKAMGKKVFAEKFGDLIINVEGGPTLASQDDDRPAIGGSAHDDYLEDDDLI